jgi:hypothetical protein
VAISAIPLNQVSEADLQRLVDNRVPENITLEFKRESYGANDQAKKEWLKDISALANTAGGDLIIGVEEEDGVASKLVGISSTTADEEIRRLEAILQDGLEPRLIGTQIHPVVLSAGGFVLVVRVLRSWNAPHRVVYQRSNRFFGRNAGSAFELGVEQLRNAFLGVAETERRLTDFRLERLARLKTGIGEPLLLGPGQLVLHLMPLQTPVVSISAHDAKQWNAEFAPMGTTSWNPFVNFDGVLLAPRRTTGGEGYTAFTQVFRSGRIEAARGLMLYRHDEDDPFYIDRVGSVPYLLESIPTYVRSLGRLGIGPPFIAMVSLLDVRGSVMGDPNRMFTGRLPRLDRDDLLFDPVLIETAEFAPGWQKTMRPVLEAWWNAYGWDRCMNLFNEAGDWTGYPADWHVPS